MIRAAAILAPTSATAHARTTITVGTWDDADLAGVVRSRGDTKGKRFVDRRGDVVVCEVPCKP